MSRRGAGLRSAARSVVPALLPHRIRMALPVIGQCALTAGAAWWIAATLFGHQAPIFAATGSLICLSAGMGGRGRQAVDLFVGVLAGVAVGEGVQALDLGIGFLVMVPALALAMSIAALIDPRPLTYVQSGTAVLIVAALGPARSPAGYLLDVAVGGALGLLGSQVLFSPDPVKLVAAPVPEILRDTAIALRTAAEALRRGGPALAATACEQARHANARLGRLTEARVVAHRVTGRTVRGRRRAARLHRADRPLDDVHVLVAAALLLCDDVHGQLTSHPTAGSGPLPDRLTELADGLAELSAATTDRSGSRPGSTAPVPSGPGDRPVIEVHLRDATAALHRLRAAAPP
ncbi:FUSC family protein [Micromonospora palomenae]|uniref:FUSC family protein n=1 Tax=Micromonospora palomenae TaxID=1461247 RepID=UPI003F8A3B9D